MPNDPLPPRTTACKPNEPSPTSTPPEDVEYGLPVETWAELTPEVLASLDAPDASAPVSSARPSPVKNTSTACAPPALPPSSDNAS